MNERHVGSASTAEGAAAPVETIVAVATAPGKAALAVVRISGPRAVAIAGALTGGERVLRPRVATLVRVVVPVDERGGAAAAIDEGIATWFAGPASFTGEDVVEFGLHGSPAIVAAVVGAAVRAGARQARRGEFTLRAFLNGRLDLARAEAVQDLVEATTPLQARVALDQLDGGLSGRLAEIEERIFDVVARLEASGDFPEEGYHFISAGEALEAVREIRGRIAGLLKDAGRGRMVREGLVVALVGRPNVGKSSLFNRVVGVDRAIVAATPGTTRDLLIERAQVGEIGITLVDSAGFRPGEDAVEREGVARAERAWQAADVVVVVLDGSEAPRAEDETLLERTRGARRVVAVNKVDIAGEAWWRGTSWATGGEAGVVEVSAMTGAGVDALMAGVVGKAELGDMTEPPQLMSARHAALLGQAAERLDGALSSAGALGQMPEEALLSDLREALGPLQQVTGKRTADDVLEAIFSRFCIGK